MKNLKPSLKAFIGLVFLIGGYIAIHALYGDWRGDVVWYTLIVGWSLQFAIGYLRLKVQRRLEQQRLSGHRYWFDSIPGWLRMLSALLISIPIMISVYVGINYLFGPARGELICNTLFVMVWAVNIGAFIDSRRRAKRQIPIAT